MKNLLLICLSWILITGCDHRTGSGNMVSRVEDVASFNKISVSGVAFRNNINVLNLTDKFIKLRDDRNIIAHPTASKINNDAEFIKTLSE